MNLSSYKIFSIFGIDVELHWSFILFMIAFLFIDPSFSLVIMIIFIFVTLHEVSHSLVSRSHDVEVKKILLLPIGGMAMMDTTDMDPWTEIKMALAGPALNFVAAALLFVLISLAGFPILEWFSSFWADPEFSLPLAEMLVFYAFYANIALGTFNLLVPAFPLDGGRVFRGLLAMKYPYLRATNIAKYVSYSISIGLFSLGALALFSGAGGMWIMIIALFIALGAAGEYRGLVTHTSLSRIDLKTLISQNYPTLYPEETVEEAVDRVMISHRSNGLIVDGEPGVIDISKLKKLDKDKWSNTQISEIKKPVKSFEINEDAEKIFKYIQSTGLNPVPIVEKGELIGTVYMSDIQRVMEMMKQVGGINEPGD